MSIAANQNTTLPALFEAHLIRRVFHDNKWHFSIVDVIAALTDSPNPSDYLSKLRRRDPEIRKGEGQFVHPLCVATAGGTQKVKCAPAEWIFRLIQSIPSPRAEPFKLWLSQVGAERIREEANPDLITDRTIKSYRKRGMADSQILERIKGRLARRSLTDAWSEQGVVKHYEYKNLTNAFYKEAFGMTAAGLCKALGVERNPRAAMCQILLMALSTGEAVAEATAQATEARGYYECKAAAQAGGAVTRSIIQNAEASIGRRLLGPQQPSNNNRIRRRA